MNLVDTPTVSIDMYRSHSDSYLQIPMELRMKLTTFCRFSWKSVSDTHSRLGLSTDTKLSTETFFQGFKTNKIRSSKPFFWDKRNRIPGFPASWCFTLVTLQQKTACRFNQIVPREWPSKSTSNVVPQLPWIFLVGRKASKASKAPVGGWKGQWSHGMVCLLAVCVDFFKRCKTCTGGQGLQWWPCLTKLVTGVEVMTDHRVPADLSRCTSCSWCSNNVALFRSFFPFSSCCFYSWNRSHMLMTSHQECLSVQSQCVWTNKSLYQLELF